MNGAGCLQTLFFDRKVNKQTGNGKATVGVLGCFQTTRNQEPVTSLLSALVSSSLNKIAEPAAAGLVGSSDASGLRKHFAGCKEPSDGRAHLHHFPRSCRQVG